MSLGVLSRGVDGPKTAIVEGVKTRQRSCAATLRTASVPRTLTFIASAGFCSPTCKDGTEEAMRERAVAIPGLPTHGRQKGCEVDDKVGTVVDGSGAHGILVSDIQVLIRSAVESASVFNAR